VHRVRRTTDRAAAEGKSAPLSGNTAVKDEGQDVDLGAHKGQGRAVSADSDGGAYRAVCERGLVPGRDVGIVGYDDSPVCGSLDVPLSSVKIHSFEMGRKAAQLLFDANLRPAVGRHVSVIMPPDLAVRESSQPQRLAIPPIQVG